MPHTQAIAGCLVAFGLVLSAQSITTVAGGGPTLNKPSDPAAVYLLPRSVATDPQGDIFFFNNPAHPRLFELPAAGGGVRWIAGNGSIGDRGDGGPARQASLEDGSMVADGSGHIFVANSRDHRVREISTATGLMTTLAGNGHAGVSGDGGPAKLAELQAPSALALDRHGDVLILDSGAACVRRIAARTRIITTVAGVCGLPALRPSPSGGLAASTQLTGPRCLTVDREGNLFISDWRRLLEVKAATGRISVLPHRGIRYWSPPASMVEAPDGSLIYTEAGFMYDLVPATGVIRIIAGWEPRDLHEVQPYGIRALDVEAIGGVALAATGGIITTMGRSIVRINPRNGTLQVLAGAQPDLRLQARKADFPWVSDLSVDAAGNRYFESLALWKQPAGSPELIRQTGFDSRHPTLCPQAQDPLGDGCPAIDIAAGGGLFVDARGNILIGDIHHRVVRKISAASGLISTVAATRNTGLAPGHITEDPAGDMFVADSMHAYEIRVGSATISRIGPGPLGASFFSITGIYAGAGGNLFLTESGGNDVREWHAATGAITTVVGAAGLARYAGDGGPAAAAALCDPRGVWGDGAGNLYISDSGNHVIREVWAHSGVITTIAGNGGAGTSGDGGPPLDAAIGTPMAITGDNRGHLFIATDVVREMPLPRRQHLSSSPPPPRACTAFENY